MGCGYSKKVWTTDDNTTPDGGARDAVNVDEQAVIEPSAVVPFQQSPELAAVMQRWTRVQQKLGTHARHPASTSVQQTPRAYALAQGAAAQPYGSAGGGPLNARHAALTPRTGRYPTIECLEQESRRLETQIRSLQQEAKALSLMTPRTAADAVGAQRPRPAYLGPERPERAAVASRAKQLPPQAAPISTAHGYGIPSAPAPQPLSPPPTQGCAGSPGAASAQVQGAAGGSLDACGSGSGRGGVGATSAAGLGVAGGAAASPCDALLESTKTLEAILAEIQDVRARSATVKTMLACKA